MATRSGNRDGNQKRQKAVLASCKLRVGKHSRPCNCLDGECVWFLSSFFGNYFAGFLGTFWERMPLESFFLMLMGLGLCGGIAIWALGRPLERVVAENDITASRKRD